MNDNKTSPLSVAVIGCGRMGAFTSDETLAGMPPGWAPLNYAEAARTTPGLELSALCDSNQEQLEKAARQHGVKIAFADHRALLEQKKPDIAVIATRMPVRGGIIRDCISAGVRGLLFEKPLATNMAEARPVLSALRDSRIPFAFGTLRRFSEAYRHARALVEAGEIGELRNIAVDHGHDMLMWGHPHSVDLLIYFSRCHEAEEIRADCTFPPDSITKDRVDCDPMLERASIRFSNGIGGNISRANGKSTHLTGTRGTLSIHADGARLELILAGKDPQLVEMPTPVLSCTQRALSELADAVRGEGEPAFTAADIEANQRLLLAIARSALAGGKSVRPGEVPDGFTVTSRYGALTA